MKLSQYLRQWQLTGELPDAPADAPMMAFWAGFLVGTPSLATNHDDRREIAIKLAEFIEERV